MSEEKFPETVKKIIKAIEDIRDKQTNKNKSSMIGKITIEVFNVDLNIKDNCFGEASVKE